MKKLATLLCIAACLVCGRARAADTDGDSVEDEDELGDTDGDGTPDVQDTDDDGDLVLTLLERMRAPQSGDTDGDNALDYLDADDDNDGILSKLELGSGGGASPRDTDSDGKFDYLDDDDDNDGELTSVERQFAPPEPDVNHNNVPDYLDAAAFGSQAGASPSDDNCDVPRVNDAGLPVCWEQDHDGDGIWSAFEGSPDFKLDNDNDGTPDFLDADDDGDGIPTKDEQPDPNQDHNPDDARSTIGNNPDYLTRDDDDDGIPTPMERPGNVDRDTDLDGRPNHRDDDDDGDGVPTSTETSGPDGVATDTNHNGVYAYLDADEKYEPETIKVVPGATDGGIAVIATLDGGVSRSSDAGTSVRRDAGASTSSPDAGSATSDSDDEESGDDEDPSESDPEAPVSSKKSSGCSLGLVHADADTLSALSCVLFALVLVRRRRER